MYKDNNTKEQQSYYLIQCLRRSTLDITDLAVLPDEITTEPKDSHYVEFVCIGKNIDTGYNEQMQIFRGQKVSINGEPRPHDFHTVYKNCFPNIGTSESEFYKYHTNVTWYQMETTVKLVKLDDK